MAIDRGSFTPPPSFNSRPSYAAKTCMSENRKNYYSRSSANPPSSDPFHIIYKVPSGDSPYVHAKRVQLIDKDPSRSISLFWRAINSGDRVNSALKDMAVVMKQLDRSDEAIEAIKSFRHLCSHEAQESLDNILIELYKRSGRLDEQVEILQEKVKRIEEEESIGGRRTKIARSQGKKVHITVEQEYSRLLGNLAWAHLQQNNYKQAEEYYRKGLSIELDKNKQCNLAICLMFMNRISEAKFLLQSIKASAANKPMDESYAKSYERAHEMLVQIESQGGLHSYMKGKENQNAQERDFDCQSQLDYIDNMCAVGGANESGSTPQTPVVSKWKTGAYTDGSVTDSRQEGSGQRLYTQPINRTQRKTGAYTDGSFSVRRCLISPSTQPKRFPVTRRNELNGDKTICQPCNLQFGKVALVFGNLEASSNDGSEVTLQKLNTNSEESSVVSPDECNTDQNPNGVQNWQVGLLGRDPNDKVEQAKDSFFPSWSCKSGKRWADMVEEDEEEDSLGFGSEMASSPGAHLSSKSSSARRSLSFDHEKQDTEICTSSPPTPEALLPCKGSNGSWKSKGALKSCRLPVFQDITPAIESRRA